MQFHSPAGWRKAWTAHPALPALFLLLVSILAYGLLIPWLHLYIDDWIWFWTWEKFGSEGVTRYFSTNRPVWGLLFQVTLPIFTRSILGSHIFALLVRWISSVACWWLLCLLWPDRPRTAHYAALIFLIYPGFALQPIALTYGHIFLIYTVFLLSLCFSLLALRNPRMYWVFTAAACLLSLVNLSTLEYFFTLELIRPVLMALVLREKEHAIRRWIAATAKHWLPYLVILLAIIVWRAFFFRYQTYYHPILLPANILAHPLSELGRLAATILQDLFETSLGAWLPAVNRLANLNLRQLSSLATLALTSAALVFTALLVWKTPETVPASTRSYRFSRPLILLGLALLLLAGWPFWLTLLEIKPVAFNSRLTLPFILGAALLLTGLLELIPSHRLRGALLAAAVALACGYHFQIANDFRLDWEHNRQLMWQIAWRIPALEEGTTLLITDFPITYYNTAALSTELNAIYPVVNRSPDLAYYLLYSRELNRSRKNGLATGQRISGSNVSASFHGSTSQVLAAQFNFSRCFRLVEPDLDAFDATLQEHLRKAAQLTRLDLVRVDQPAALPPRNLFGAAPAQQWCYYFEKADLARQSHNWQEAARLWDAAQAEGLHPSDEMEKLVFIEAFAHTGQWEQAVKISRGFQDAEKRPMLCRLWQRIADKTTESAQKADSINDIIQTTGCVISNR